MSSWLTRILVGEPGFEREVVDRYTHRLLLLARQQLPERLRGRIDPEDVLQSVYRSFFCRLNDGQFSFAESHDVWRLLTVMTYHKLQNTIKFHQRECRDVRRERPLQRPGDDGNSPAIERLPGPEDVAMLFDCLEYLLKGLPEKYQRMVSLRLQGHSIEDVSRQMDCSRRTVLRVLANVQNSATRQMETCS